MCGGAARDRINGPAASRAEPCHPDAQRNGRGGEMRRSAYALSAIAVLAVFAGSSRAEMVCLTLTSGEAPTRLRASRYVVVARVEDPDPPLQAAQGNYRLVPIRTYKGKAKGFSVSLLLWEDSGNLTVGDFVLVFANSTDIAISNLCKGPYSLRQAEIRRAVTILDKQMHFPPLSIPTESSKD